METTKLETSPIVAKQTWKKDLSKKEFPKEDPPKEATNVTPSWMKKLGDKKKDDKVEEESKKEEDKTPAWMKNKLNKTEEPKKEEPTTISGTDEEAENAKPKEVAPVKEEVVEPEPVQEEPKEEVKQEEPIVEEPVKEETKEVVEELVSVPEPVVEELVKQEEQFKPRTSQFSEQKIVENIEEWSDFEDFFYMPNEFPQPKNDYSERDSILKFQNQFFRNQLILTDELYREKLKDLEDKTPCSILVFYQLGLLFFYCQKHKLIPKVFQNLKNNSCYKNIPKALQQMIEIHLTLYETLEDKETHLTFNVEECHENVKFYYYYFLSQIELKKNCCLKADEYIQKITKYQNFSSLLFYRQKLKSSIQQKKDTEHEFKMVKEALAKYQCTPMMAYLIQIEFSHLLNLQEYQKILDYTNYEPKETYHYKLVQIYSDCRVYT
jgi:hypothetical protein